MEKLERIKQLRKRYPNVDLQSAKNAIEEGWWIIYINPYTGQSFDNLADAIDDVKFCDEWVSWIPNPVKKEFVPYEDEI